MVQSPTSNVQGRKPVMTNVELLLRWIPAFAGMTMPAPDPDPGYFVMLDLISLTCEILFCLYLTGPAPYLIRGHPERKQGQQRQLRNVDRELRIGASTMNRQDLEKRTKEFALEIIRLLSNLPRESHFTAEDAEATEENRKRKLSVLSYQLNTRIRGLCVASEPVSDVKDN